MENHITHFMINAKDVGVTAEFYKKMFGFNVEYVTEDWAELKMGNGMELAIKKQFEGDSVGSSGIGFTVADCKFITNILKEKGAQVKKDCELIEDGTKYFSQIVDPDGDIIWLIQRIK